MLLYFLKKITLFLLNMNLQLKKRGSYSYILLDRIRYITQLYALTLAKDNSTF